MSKTTITLQGTDAINLTNIKEGGTAPSVTLPQGKYAVNIESTVKFHDQIWELDQVILFSTSPLNSNESERWYFVVNESQGIQIEALENEPIYAVILDQVTSQDNTGSMTITFTPLN